MDPMDALIAFLESLEAPPWVFLVLFLVPLGFLAGIWLYRHKIQLEINHDACSTYVDFATRRVYRVIVYKVKYPVNLAFLSLWLHNVEIKFPRAGQVERVAYIHPDHDPLDEPTQFSRLGKLVVGDRGMRQTIPKDVVRKALGLREKVLGFIPFYAFKGVDTVVLEVSYSLGEDLDESQVLYIEPVHRPDECILRFIIHKNEQLSKVYRYRLRYSLPECIKSFVGDIEYHPLTARLAVTPQDITVISAHPFDRFDRDTPSESYELDWIFDISQDAIVELRYEEV
jgi:hypothetical protein